MTLSNHTTSLELAIALRDAGWPQEGSLFYWVKSKLNDSPWELITNEGKEQIENNGWPSFDFVASPTASELMERMKHETTLLITAHEDDNGFTLIVTQSL